MNLNQMLADKARQFDRIAEAVICDHGRAGGAFVIQMWRGNKKLMASPIGDHLPGHAVPILRFKELEKNGWRM